MDVVYMIYMSHLYHVHDMSTYIMTSRLISCAANTYVMHGGGTTLQLCLLSRAYSVVHHWNHDDDDKMRYDL